MKKPRHLSIEERALWDQVARRTVPITPKVPTLPKEARAPQSKPRPDTPSQAVFSEFRIGQSAGAGQPNDLLPSLSERLKRGPVNMDSRSFGKLKRGKLRPESRIDLHGMTTAEAHPALVSFILKAHSAGKRLVLVITGKGKERDGGGPIPVRLGVLRHQVPQWLALPPLSHAILQVAPAHLRHGGQGAYYVYLRRQR